MSIPSLPPYVGLNSLPTPNITPFTYRDGVTYQERLDNLAKYINRVLIPQVELSNAALAAAFTEAVEAILGDAVEVQDPIVAAMLADPESDSRATLNAILETIVIPKPGDDGVYTVYGLTPEFELVGVDVNSRFPDRVEARLALQFAAKNASYTKTESDDKYETQTGAASAHNSLDARLDTAETDINSLETLTTAPNRLSQTAMDARYLLHPGTPHAVFIGSSNSTAGNTWVEDFCTQMGFIAHNYSQGGGGFTQAGGSQFIAQMNNAIADNTYDHNLVKYVFICDMGNDIRATNSIAATAPAVFSAARTAYPTARIILIPALWGNATDNNVSGRIISISQRVAEAVNAGLQFGIEIVDKSWLWLADAGNWMTPGEVHMNVSGYARVADFMVRYMKGNNTGYDFPVQLIPPASAVDANSAYWTISRSGDIAALENRFNLPGAVGLDVNLGTLPYGTWPMHTLYIPVVAESTRDMRTIAVTNTGLIRSFATMASATYLVDAHFRVF